MENKELAEKFGETVRQLRRNVKLSQEDFADKCGLHRTYIGSVERGEKTVTIESAKKIVTALNLKLWQFFQQIEE